MDLLLGLSLFPGLLCFFTLLRPVVTSLTCRLWSSLSCLFCSDRLLASFASSFCHPPQPQPFLTLSSSLHSDSLLPLSVSFFLPWASGRSCSLPSLLVALSPAWARVSSRARLPSAPWARVSVSSRVRLPSAPWARVSVSSRVRLPSAPWARVSVSSRVRLPSAPRARVCVSSWPSRSRESPLWFWVCQLLGQGCLPFRSCNLFCRLCWIVLGLLLSVFSVFSSVRLSLPCPSCQISFETGASGCVLSQNPKSKVSWESEGKSSRLGVEVWGSGKDGDGHGAALHLAALHRNWGRRRSSGRLPQAAVEHTQRVLNR